jgi:glycosyltransferase involved in cell wall biosynthesis
LRIAQIAPLYESVPPRLYGGTERVVSYLTEELVAQGHEVTLFASADSRTAARLVSSSAESLRLARAPIEALASQLLQMEQLRRDVGQFDIVHNHVDYLPFPLLRGCARASLTTPHGRLDGPQWGVMAHRYRELALSSISFAQRRPLPKANWTGTVYHGIPVDRHAFRARHGDYLVFLGRISPEKRVDRAIEIARRAGMPLKIAAKVGTSDATYFDRWIAPLLDDPLVEFLGEVDEAGKDELLGNAFALLFPIAWPEPFGLAMIEAMACGTPVVAFRRGSVPEIVQDGVNGFIVDDVAGAVAALDRVVEMERRDCRALFEQRFTAKRMASDYVALYTELVDDFSHDPFSFEIQRSVPRGVARTAPIPDNLDGERARASA